ncbi:hypothetical protein [Embleya sp. NBC_00896]|uniref:hypothetical protein n=1 Tax=Embleya sp. NBC_00896 TaxID=2975961 RepID=UPI00386C570C|nr:hypothetical protein OG928_01000 [Embleya sp. NBC_00896]
MSEQPLRVQSGLVTRLPHRPLDRYQDVLGTGVAIGRSDLQQSLRFLGDATSAIAERGLRPGCRGASGVLLFQEKPCKTEGRARLHAARTAPRDWPHR